MLPKRRKVDEITYAPTGQSGDAVEVDSRDRGRAAAKVPARKFHALKRLGSGTFGQVILVECKTTGRLLALKKVKKCGDEVSQEVEILSQIGDHPNLVKFVDWFITKDKEDKIFMNIVSEYAGPHSLHDLTQSAPLSPTQTRDYMFQVLCGLNHVHSRGIIHRDLKPSNIMIDEAEAVRVIDFGSAMLSSNARRHACYVVSRYYRAPELILGAEQYTEKIDIWSVGCITWELLMGTVLFGGADTTDQLIRIIAVLGSPTSSQFKAMKVKDRSAEYVQIVASVIRFRADTVLSFPKVVPLDFRTLLPGTLATLADFLSKTLQYDPTARPSCAELLQHPFFSMDFSRM